MYTKPWNASPTKTLEPMAVTIKSVTESDMTDVVAVQVLAFITDPIARWMYPDPHHYLTCFPRFIRTFGGKAFEHHTAYYLEDYRGAALWFPPGVEPDVEPLVDLIYHSVATQDQADLFAVLEQMGNYHPTEPHWYLAILGVEPTQQNKGYGSALIQNILQECDRSQIPAYLESSNPSNIPFYERHGFEIIGTIQAGASPRMFPMIRYPQ
jgi:ribosomal protein S18 acetylase RimI-like enzyme